MNTHKKPKKQFNQKKKLGLVHVYTGDGKGKTTAALGLMMRALGHDYRVLMVRFLRGYKDTGEIKALSKIKGEIEILPFASEEPIDLLNPTPTDYHLAEQAMAYVRRIMVEKRPDLLVLDEINPAVHHGLIDIKDIIDFLDHRHQQTEIVLTGRDAHPELLNYADLVTVMHCSKDYFNHALFETRFGIEH
ncbi:MAG: cob(I)yrinic acid a,c-diamide adenosyltransferase [Patescibacteria group bacterium]